GGKVSCGFVFASADYRAQIADFLELIQLHGHVPILAGCSGMGLIGSAVEAEGASGFSLLLLNLPQTTIHTVQLPGANAGFRNASGEDLAIGAGRRRGDMNAWTILAD